jgi:hypothetical protein
MSLIIAQVEPPQNTDGGDYYYRTYVPGIAMSKLDGIWVVNMTNVHRTKREVMQCADVLVLKNICDPDVLPLIRQRRARGQVTIYELADDLNALQSWNPVYRFYNNKENLALVYRIASCCDGLQVTVEHLRMLYGHLNGCCKVLANQILHVPPERAKESENKNCIVVGWGGSHGHLEDISHIAGPLIDWIHRRSDIVLHLMCSEPIWKIFDGLPSRKKQHTLPGSIYDYYAFLNNIDIGVGPLRDTAFNRSRSDVKFLEYAVSGVVPVMQDLGAYHETVQNGQTGYLFRDNIGLIAVLEQLANNPILLKNTASTARHYVLKKRLQTQHVQERIDFYGSFENLFQRRPYKSSGNTGVFETWSELEGAVRDGRYLKLADTRFEKFLHDGLVAMQMDGQPDDALRLFEKASSLVPDSYLPFLYGSAVAPDPICFLQKALELEPRSLKAWVLLGEAYSRANRIEETMQCFDTAVQVCPDYSVPYLRAAHVLEKLGNQSQANMLFQKAEALGVERKMH